MRRRPGFEVLLLVLLLGCEGTKASPTVVTSDPSPQTSSKPAAVSSASSAASNSPARPSLDQDQAAVKQTFLAYQKAIGEKRGDQAADLAAQKTIAYFEWSRKSALTMPEDELRKQSLLDRMQVLVLRAKVDPATLRKMDGLLHKLITVNEVSSRALRPEPLDVSRIVSQLSEEKVPAHFKFHNMVPPCLTLVSDGYFFRLVMASLIENAAAYHPSEPSHTPEIRVSAIENPAFVTVTVADNGLGIPREMQEKVFEMFVRGTVQGHGNGLGLYVAKAASERIHGKLACGDSHMGGSEFVFTVANRP